MAVRSPAPATLSAAEARRIWIGAQRLDAVAPFGAGPAAVRAAVEHLGYVQIDTINVIERSHHHILWTRIPEYRREDLRAALSVEKSVFEYWTHALAYVPTRDFRFFMADMARHRESPIKWFGAVTPAELRRIVARVRREGALSIRDIEEEPLTLIRPTVPRTVNNMTVQSIQDLVYRIRSGQVDLYQAEAKLQKILKNPVSYPRWVHPIAAAGIASGVGLMFTTNWRIILITFVISYLV